MSKHKVFLSNVCRKCMLLLGFCLFGSLAVNAQDTEEAKWLLVTNDGQKIDMEIIGSFVLADDADAFDVLDTSGNLLIPKVTKVSFEYFDPTGITKPQDVTKKTSLLSYSVNKQLTIVGTANEAQVYSAAGVLVASGKSKEGTVVIDVSHLSQGIYMVRAGKQTFKFIKK